MIFYTLAQVAEQLQVSKETVTRLIKERELCATRISGASRISSFDFLSYIRKFSTKRARNDRGLVSVEQLFDFREAAESIIRNIDAILSTVRQA